MRHLTADLAGDGRHRYDPNPEIETLGAGKPLQLTIIRVLVKQFQETGHTFHSAAGHTMWAVQEWCVLNDIRVYGFHGRHGGILTASKEEFEQFRETSLAADQG